MKNFIFHNPTKIIFGSDACSKIAAELKPLARKIMFTYGQGSIKTSGLYDTVKAQLKDFEVIEFSGIEPNPRVETIRKAVEIGKKFQPDLLLAVGGGSVIDGTKLLSAALHYNGDPWDILEDSSLVSECTPIATVLTLAASGSEMNSGAVISNWTKNLKLSFGNPNLFPVVSFLDPNNTASLSAIQTAYGIVDIYSHVLEQYITTSKDVPLQDRWSEGILKTLIETAPAVLGNGKDLTARANIMLCGTMALNGLINMGTNQDWATHRIEHEISAFYDIAHGLGLAIITPRWMQAVKEQKGDKLAQYGQRIFGLDLKDRDQQIAATIKATFDLFKSFGITMNLSELNITDKHFPEMITRLSAMKIGEFPLTKEQIETILTECLH